MLACLQAHSRLIYFLFIILIARCAAAPLLSFEPEAGDGVFATIARAGSSRNVSTLTTGWKSQPNGRGTLDIIWSCVFTIFLCSWSVLCVNVPAKNEGHWSILWRRFYLTGLGVLAPEVILQAALGQRLSAARSVKDFHEAGFRDWTLNHGFFADMGGFLLSTPDVVDFPINAKQLHYLVTRRYIHMPTILKRDIQDKNKVDPLLRAITIFQVLWFLINCIARATHGMTITTFELTTIGFIFCSLGTHLCWAHKPADVNVPVILDCSTSIARIRLEAGQTSTAPELHLTPLDFISRQDWVWSAWWTFALRVTRKFLHIRFMTKQRPIPRVPNDDWPELPLAAIIGITAFDMVYAAIYVAGWNLYFQTDVERILWRLSTMIILVAFAMFLFLYTVLLLQPTARRTIARWKLRRQEKRQGCEMEPSRGCLKAEWPRRESTLRHQESAQEREAFHLPDHLAVSFTVVAGVYLLARAYTLSECALALRQLPASAYETVSWPGFLAHV